MVVTLDMVFVKREKIGSAKTIQNSFGILENEVIDDNVEVLQRYWIDVKETIQNLQANYNHPKKL